MYCWKSVKSSSYKLFNQYKIFILTRIKQSVRLSSFEILELRQNQLNPCHL